MGHKFLKILIVIVSILSLLILMAIFVIPDSFYKNITLNKINNGIEHINKSSEIVIKIATDPLVYSGIGEVPFMDGVTAVGKDGKDYSDLVKSSVSDGVNQNQKIITYSVSINNSAPTTKKRTLLLENYKKPSITWDKKQIKVKLGELDLLVNRLISSKGLTADDGFGHNISKGITADLSAITKAGEYDVVFMVENVVNDTAQVTVDVTVEEDATGKSPIQLTTSAVTLQKGSSFNPMSYLAKATDEKGKDISSIVKVRSNVNTDVSGQYTVTYYLQGIDESTYKTATLTVIIN